LKNASLSKYPPWK